MGCVQGAEVARPDPPVRGPASDPGAGSSTVVRKPPPPAVDVNSIVVPEGFIHPRSLARFDPFQEEQPDWRWEKDEGQWRSYPLNDSIELDRYWQVFAKAGNEGGETKAKLKLLKTDVAAWRQEGPQLRSFQASNLYDKRIKLSLVAARQCQQSAFCIGYFALVTTTRMLVRLLAVLSYRAKHRKTQT
ncbi:unnamed protein product [Durusdinium trenchii]|uniref:WWE domain-containing protein n=1 Tax=Durusdinium trenchii TaxID=1381693 RepID=A0ABP0KT93_9DINO